jgi:hypothetical protein
MIGGEVRNQHERLAGTLYVVVDPQTIDIDLRHVVLSVDAEATQHPPAASERTGASRRRPRS